MSETTEKRSVRITLLDSGLSPPIFILASFTDPPWEPHEMKSAVAGGSGVNGDNPTVNNVDYMFWRRFDIYPGVWRYRFRVGLSDWLMHNYQAEVENDGSGECYNVLRIEDGGPTVFQSPAPLPVSLGEIAFSQVSSSGSNSWESTLERLDSQEPGGSCSSFVTNPFSSSPVRAATIGSATSDNPEPDEEQGLLLYEAPETISHSSISHSSISHSSSRSSSEVSVESKDQDGFFAACWQNLIAWIYGLFARLLGQPSNA